MITTEFLTEKHWTMEELERDFTVWGYDAPFLLVERKSDNKKGTVEFIDLPRLYFNFAPRAEHETP